MDQQFSRFISLIRNHRHIGRQAKSSKHTKAILKRQTADISLAKVSHSHQSDVISLLGLIKQHKLDGLMTELYFLAFWWLEIQLKVLAGWVSGEISLPGLQTATFSLCPHMAFPLCAFPC